MEKDFQPGRWTYRGQVHPWAVPIPPASAEEKSWRFEDGGMSPLFMRGLVDALACRDPAGARAMLEQDAPAILSLGREDWRGWVEEMRTRLDEAIKSARSGP